MSRGNRSNATAAPTKGKPAAVAATNDNVVEKEAFVPDAQPGTLVKQEAAPTPTAQAQAKPPAANDLTDDDSGFEEMDASHFVIPYLGILQPLSPQVLEAKEQYIPGAKAGMLYNSVTGRTWDGKQGVRFIPVHVQHQQVEWVPRDQGGQLIARHEVDEPAVLEARKKFPVGKAPFGDGNELIETFYVYGLIIESDGRFERVAVSFKSTDINEYKKWMTNARSVQKVIEGRVVTPPLYSHFFRMRSVAKNKNNYDWYGWGVRFDAATADIAEIAEDSQLYAEAKAFRALAKANRIRTADATVSNEAEETTDEL